MIFKRIQECRERQESIKRTIDHGDKLTYERTSDGILIVRDVNGKVIQFGDNAKIQR